jgi:hypothetical protein
MLVLVTPSGVLAPGSTIPPDLPAALGRGVDTVAFSTAWEFTSRSQLRDSPGFAPAFPLG